MTTRITIALVAAVIIIVGGVVLWNRAGTRTPALREKISQTTETSPETLPTLETVEAAPAGWQRYQHESLLFTLDYPAGWTYRIATEDYPIISLLPPNPAPQEIELNPRIILKLVPLVNFLGAYESSAAWFEGEVLKNPERWDARADDLNKNPRYAFTEGAGEYPHENIIILRGATAYWFSIEASDPAMHELLPQIASSLQF